MLSKTLFSSVVLSFCSLMLFNTLLSIVAILELIRGAQCLIEVIRSSGEEM
jgi:hypothetical protein